MLFKILLFLLGFSYLIRAEQRETVYVRNHELTLFSGGDDNVVHRQAMGKCSFWKPGAHLVMVKDEQIQNAVDDLLEAWEFPNTWLGGSDYIFEGIWKWLDGTYLESGYTNWDALGKPLPGQWHVNLYGDCLAQWNYTWNDKFCSVHEIGYICQIDTSEITESHYSDLTYSFAAGFAEDLIPRKSYDKAKTYCEQQGSRLPKIGSENLFEKIRRYITKMYYSSIRNSTKVWVDAEPRADGKCVVIGNNGWEKTDCGKELQFACEKIFPWNVKVSDGKPTIIEGDDLEIDCIASGFPLPEMSWFQNAVEITDDVTQRVHQVKSEAKSVLVIRKADTVDSGKYQCFASNNMKRSARGFTMVEVYEQGFDLTWLEATYGGLQGYKSLINFMNRDTEKKMPEFQPMVQEFGPTSKPVENILCNKWILPAGIALALMWVILIAFLFYKCRYDSLQPAEKES